MGVGAAFKRVSTVMMCRLSCHASCSRDFVQFSQEPACLILSPHLSGCLPSFCCHLGPGARQGGGRAARHCAGLPRRRAAGAWGEVRGLCDGQKAAEAGALACLFCTGGASCAAVASWCTILHRGTSLSSCRSARWRGGGARRRRSWRPSRRCSSAWARPMLLLCHLIYLVAPVP